MIKTIQHHIHTDYRIQIDIIISDYFTMAPSTQCITNEPPRNEILVDMTKILILDSART